MPARIVRPIAFLTLVLLLPLAAAARPAETTDWEYRGLLLAGDGEDRHNFGFSVALDGDTALIGAAGWNSEHGDYTGAAYIFTHGGATGWSERARLMASDSRQYQLFGGAVDLEGNTAVIGAYRANLNQYGQPNFQPQAGAAYIFTGSGATWTQQIKLQPNDLIDDNAFGQSLDLDGDTLIIGAPDWSDYERESVYVYSRAGGNWGAPQRLSLLEPAFDHNFGTSVAVAGDVALVGAPGPYCCDATQLLQEGVVYVYTRAGGVWSPAGTLTADDGFAGNLFGHNIVFDGQTAVIGAAEAIQYGTVGTLPGYAYVFTRDGDTWTQTARLEPAVDQPYLIGSVDMAGDRIVLGATEFRPTSYVGRFFFFRRDGADWVEETPLGPPDALPDTGFGGPVALNDEHLLAGAPYKDNLNVDEQGAVYAFGLAPDYDAFVFAPIILRPGQAGPGGLIAYCAYGVNDKSDIWTIRPDGTGKTNLTQTPQDDCGPAWSPDGTRLAFSQTRADYQATLVVTDAAGNNKQTLTADPDLEFIGTPTWSPDGARLAFDALNDDEGYDIYVINADGSGLTNITPALPGHSTLARWSPDGTKILFTNYASDSAYRHLATVAPTGGPVTFLTDDERHYDYPAWSPDGTKILFTGGVEGTQVIFTMPAAGGAATPLLESATMGSWSPDGTQIVFIGDAGGLFRANADGSGITPIDPTESVFSPDWKN